MLAYAAGRQGMAARRSSPSTMLLIIGGHIAAVAVAMSVKMAVDHKEGAPPTEVVWVKPETPPPPPQVKPQPSPQPPVSTPYQPPVAVPTPPLSSDPVETGAIPQPYIAPIAGKDLPLPPTILPMPPADPVRVGPRLATPPTALRPPYPASKLDSEEEAALRLRLSIDERGRVTAVDAVGPADPAFLASARKHLIAKWRYKPATVDGRPVATFTVITLRFELEG